MMEASTDTGTVLAKDAYGVLWSPKDGFSMLMPNMGPESELPPEAVALMGSFMRLLNDPGFAQDCIDWMQEQKNVAS